MIINDLYDLSHIPADLAGTGCQMYDTLGSGVRWQRQQLPRSYVTTVPTLTLTGKDVLFQLSPFVNGLIVTQQIL